MYRTQSKETFYNKTKPVEGRLLAVAVVDVQQLGSDHVVSDLMSDERNDSCTIPVVVRVLAEHQVTCNPHEDADSMITTSARMTSCTVIEALQSLVSVARVLADAHELLVHHAHLVPLVLQLADELERRRHEHDLHHFL